LAKFNYAIQLSSSRAVQLVANLVSDLSQLDNVTEYYIGLYSRKPALSIVDQTAKEVKLMQAY